jgi:hypothetical protein
MDVLFLLVTALATLVNTSRAARNRSVSPCYAAYTAFIADSAPLRVRRIVTTGVRRFGDAHTRDAPACEPADPQRVADLKAAVTAQLGSDVYHAAWVQIESTDSTIAGDHLERLASFAIRDSITEIVHTGSKADLVVVPRR